MRRGSPGPRCRRWGARATTASRCFSSANSFSTTPRKFGSTITHDEARRHNRVVYDVPTIETERLFLRAWSEEDRDAFALINADPRVMEHFPALMSREQSDSLVDRIDADWQQGFG